MLMDFILGLANMKYYFFNHPGDAEIVSVRCSSANSSRKVSPKVFGHFEHWQVGKSAARPDSVLGLLTAFLEDTQTEHRTIRENCESSGTSATADSKVLTQNWVMLLFAISRSTFAELLPLANNVLAGSLSAVWNSAVCSMWTARYDGL